MTQAQTVTPKEAISDHWVVGVRDGETESARVLEMLDQHGGAQKLGVNIVTHSLSEYGETPYLVTPITTVYGSDDIVQVIRDKVAGQFPAYR